MNYSKVKLKLKKYKEEIAYVLLILIEEKYGIMNHLEINEKAQIIVKAIIIIINANRVMKKSDTIKKIFKEDDTNEK